MKYVPWFTGRAVLSLAAAVASFVSIANAQIQSGQVLIQAVHGSATYSSAGQTLPLKENLVLSRGAVLKTEKDATVDLVLHTAGRCCACCRTRRSASTSSIKKARAKRLSPKQA